MAQLIVMAAPDPQQENKNFVLVGGDTVGSDPGNSIVLHSTLVKPRHASLRLGDDDNFQLISVQGEVLVNDTPTQMYTVSHGDIIMIGDYLFLFDEQREITKQEVVEDSVDDTVQSRIESSLKHYDSSQQVIQSLRDEKSDGRLITLYRISHAISGILDLDELLQKFLDIILDEFPADRGFIMLYDRAKESLTPAAVNFRDESVGRKYRKKYEISRTIVDKVLSTKESVLSENVMDDKDLRAQESLVQENIVSAMCVPLIRKGEILGIIHLDSQRSSSFSSTDLDLLTKVALQASMVIENARFYRVRQEFNRNLLALSHATQKLSSYLRQDLIIQDSVRYASRIFSCHKSYLLLQSEGEFQLAQAVGTKEENFHFVLSSTFATLLNDNKNLLVREEAEIPEDLRSLVAKGIFSRSFAIASINSSSEETVEQTEAIGLLCISHKAHSEPFSAEDMQLLTILSRYTAIALSNSRFYQELKSKEEEIARWNQELEKKVAERTSRLKVMQSQLSQSEKMAAVGLLAAGVSHEFNNIIASMYGFAQIAKKNGKYKDKLVDIVINQSKRACDITESLLSFSKQRGEVQELIDVAEIVEHVLQLTMAALENEGIKIVKEFAEVPKTMANPNKIQQVFLNIIINARHAIERMGTITIRISATEKQIHVAFSDTGKGIPEKDLKRVFEPFYTTKGSFGGGTQPGTGIGLSLCYNIIQGHGGDILVESEYGKGATFTVVLPIRAEPYISKDVQNETQKMVAKVFTGQRVLIVEDTDDIRELLTKVLEDKDFEVHAVSNGSEAIERCKKERFGIIFLDIRMPEKVDGFTVFDEVKRLDPNVKVILITGRAEDATLMRYVGYADGYLRKPFHIDDIYRIVDSAESKS